MRFEELTDDLRGMLASAPTDSGEALQTLYGVVPLDLVHHEPRDGGFLLSDLSAIAAALGPRDPPHQMLLFR